jgi:hypothetical protein
LAENLVLFGAGASYGSDWSGTPPLGCDLFDELCRFNSTGWGTLPDELVVIFRKDFEEGMSKVSDFNPHRMPILQRAMAAYFFNYKPTTNSLYLRLAERLAKRSWNGAFTSLNYERLFELCLGHSGIRPVVGRETEGNNEIELILPHGCCHIFCDAVRGSSSGVSFSGIGVSTDGNVSVVSDTTQFNSRIQNDAFPPVMSYFEPSKRTSTGVSFIASQRKRWGELVHSASKLAVIGVGVRSVDTHIWKPIRESSCRIVYCGGPDGGQDFRSWAEENKRISSSSILEGYFRDEFEAICDEIDI